jgi:uncharacterized protein
MFISTAVIPTEKGSRYLQQLCKHWKHNLTVEYDAHQGKVIFPKDARGADWPSDGIFTLQASDTALTCRIEASALEQLAGLKGAVERHLDRFAFREGKLVCDWQDG